MGPHASGADFDANEHAMLKRIAQNAAAVYAELENNDLRHKISILERKLSANGSARAKRSKRGESGRRGRCRQALSSFERAIIFYMVPAPRTVEQRGGCCGWQATELGWRA
jgi:hypothetical protein